MHDFKFTHLTPGNTGSAPPGLSAELIPGVVHPLRHLLLCRMSTGCTNQFSITHNINHLPRCCSCRGWRTSVCGWSLAILIILMAAPAVAQQAGIIQGMQMPAWIERKGAKAPVSPGMLIESGDRIQTGSGARILLNLDEGSLVKLGENADFTVRDVIRAETSDGVFSGFLDVVKGAFRFTTTLISKSQRRNLIIRVSAVTAGIRGTDLWGKAAPDKDIVCLINGDINVQHQGQEPFRMNQPLSFYIAPKNAPAKPVSPVDPQQLKRWATEVELTNDDGALTTHGPWNLILMSLKDRSSSQRRQRQIQAAGYPAVIQKTSHNDSLWYRVVIPGFARFTGAENVARSLENRFGISKPWIIHNG